MDIAKLVFGLSALVVRLNKLSEYKDENQLDIDTKRKRVLISYLSLSFRKASSRRMN